MFRGALVSCIYSKTVFIAEGSFDNAAALTLMSSDVDAIAGSLQNIHEIWASAIELAIAIYLLERQVGVACLVTVALVIGDSIISPEYCFSADKEQLVQYVPDDSQS